MLKTVLAGVGCVAVSAAAWSADPAPRAAEPPSQGQEDQGLQEIVVTAQRREESVQRSALAIQALSSEALERSGVTRPEDLSAVATGVNIGTGGNDPMVYIRGLGNYSTNNYAEGAVAWNSDGVYVSRPWETRGLFFDLARAEVLKGPQGTLYGRNATGGAINLISARPSLGETSGFFEGEGGNYDLAHFTGALNVPLSQTLALRASGQVISRQGYLSDGYDDDREQSARLQLLYQPGGDFSLLLKGEYQHVDGRGAGQVLVPQLAGSPWRGASDAAVNAIILAEPGTGPLLMPTQDDGFLKIDVRSASAELIWDFGPATLTVIPAYKSGEHSDRFYVANFQVNDHEYDHQTSVEARLSGQSDRLKWVLGTYYFNEDQGNPPGQPILLANSLLNAQQVSDFRGNTTSYAAFAQSTFSIVEAFRLTGGLRYTYESKTQNGLAAGFNPAFLVAPGACAADPAAPSPVATCRTDIPLSGSLHYNNVTYKAGFEYDLAARSMLYANVSTGFKSGGFYAAPAPNTFRPEKLTAYDVGLKNRFLDNHLEANLEAFYWRYRDHQENFLAATSVPGYDAFITQNAGSAKTYGAELDLAYRLTAADRLNLSAQYDKSQYDTFNYTVPNIPGPHVWGCKATAPNAPINSGIGSYDLDCSGLPLIRAPEWTGTAGYEHTFGLPRGARLTAGVSSQFSSSYYTAIDFLPNERQQSYAILNSDLSYTSPDGSWSLTAWGRNLTGEAVLDQTFRSLFVTAANPAANPNGFVLGSIRPPRTYGVRLHIDF